MEWHPPTRPVPENIIKNLKWIKFLQNKITDLWQIKNTINDASDKKCLTHNQKKNWYNPHPQPVSIRRDQLFLLKQQPYAILEKSDGIRYALLLTHFDGKNIAALVNRKGVCYQIYVEADQSYFVKNTLIDGELVIESNSILVYWAFDIICYQGHNCTHYPYKTRMFILSKCIEDEHYDTYNYNAFSTKQYENNDNNDTLVFKKTIALENPQIRHDREKDLLSAKLNRIVAVDNINNIRLLCKKYVLSNTNDHVDLLQLWQDLVTQSLTDTCDIGHSCDGLVFTPINESLPRGTFWHQFKWKNIHTIDCILTLIKSNQIIEKETQEQHLINKVGDWYITLEIRDHDCCIDLLQDNVYLERPVASSIKLNCVLHMTEFLTNFIKAVNEEELEKLQCIVECKCHLSTKIEDQYIVMSDDNQSIEEYKMILEILKIRNDKQYSNNLYTIKETFINTLENIQIEELAEYF